MKDLRNNPVWQLHCIDEKTASVGKQKPAHKARVRLWPGQEQNRTFNSQSSAFPPKDGALVKTWITNWLCLSTDQMVRRMSC